MGVRVTVLGCGGSSGVPAPAAEPGGWWGACDPQESRNRRRRASILIETQDVRILVDATPDLREQLLDVGAKIDAIVFTHAHADHVHGVDDLRMVCKARSEPLDAFAWAAVHREIAGRFAYAYQPLRGGDYFYKPVLHRHDVMDRIGRFEIAGVECLTFAQDHGVGGASMGLRIGRFAYSTDVWSLDDDAFDALSGVEAWIVGCLDDRPNPAHADVDLAFDWIARVGARRAWLTHLGPRLDYAAVLQRCPPGVAPAYDGLVFDVAD